jgi:hypothetical protein
MNINKKYEFNVKNKDISILEVINNFIITDNNYKGLAIYDDRLSPIKSILLPQDVLMHHIYAHYLKNEILIYDFDNSMLIWVDIDKSIYRSISTNSLPENTDFSSIYYWKNQEIVLIDYKGYIYIFDTKQGSLHQVSSDIIEKQYPDFFAFWMYTKSCTSSMFFPKQQVIINDTDEKIIRLIEFPILTKKEFKRPHLRYHDIVYEYGFCVFVAEEGIEIVNITTYEIIALSPDKDYYFGRARFMKHDNQIFLVVLSLLGNYDSTITVYEINQ